MNSEQLLFNRQLGRDLVLRRAEENLASGKLNTGLTFYSPRHREAVMVVALTSSASEFFNSLMHELSHLTAYIA